MHHNAVLFFDEGDESDMQGPEGLVRSDLAAITAMADDLAGFKAHCRIFRCLSEAESYNSSFVMKCSVPPPGSRMCFLKKSIINGVALRYVGPDL
jgi:hypothetical protein